MKTIFICFLVSFLVHITVFFCLDHSVGNMHLTHFYHQSTPLHLVINHKTQSSKVVPANPSDKLRRQIETSSTNQTKEEVNKDVIIKPLTNGYQKPNVDADSTAAAKPAVDVSVVNYLGPNLIDRKALPLTNIDRSMLAEYTYSGFSIRLRLYINSTGKLMKVERISILDQDAQFVGALEKLLNGLHFLPAKRDGQDVNSYQDVEFSFDISR